MVRSWSLGDPTRKIIQGVEKNRKIKTFQGFETGFKRVLLDKMGNPQP